MIAKMPAFVNFVEAIIYLLLYNLHECTFKLLQSYFLAKLTKLVRPFENWKWEKINKKFKSGEFKSEQKYFAKQIGKS